jgi:hypothetical protein
MDDTTINCDKAEIRYKNGDVKELRHDVILVEKTEDAIARLLELRRGGFWSFRGQADSAWKLGLHDNIRSKLRGTTASANSSSAGPDAFDVIRRQYVRRCREFDEGRPGFRPDENNYWQSIFFAQHHGLRTLLLDWTKNPLVALYFSVENIRASPNGTTRLIKNGNEYQANGCVWAIRVRQPSVKRSNCRDVNAWREQKRKKWDQSAEKWYEADELPGYDGELESKFTLDAPWIIINPPLLDDRIVRQSSVFTYPCNRDYEEDLACYDWQSQGDERLIQVVIVGDGTSRLILKDLGYMNVHHASMFPDYDGVAAFTNHQWPVLQHML